MFLMAYIFRKLWSAGYDVALSVKHLFDVIQEVRRIDNSGMNKISVEEEEENKQLIKKIFS